MYCDPRLIKHFYINVHYVRGTIQSVLYMLTTTCPQLVRKGSITSSSVGLRSYPNMREKRDSDSHRMTKGISRYCKSHLFRVDDLLERGPNGLLMGSPGLLLTLWLQ